MNNDKRLRLRIYQFTTHTQTKFAHGYHSSAMDVLPTSYNSSTCMWNAPHAEQVLEPVGVSKANGISM